MTTPWTEVAESAHQIVKAAVAPAAAELADRRALLTGPSLHQYHEPYGAALRCDPVTIVERACEARCMFTAASVDRKHSLRGFVDEFSWAMEEVAFDDPVDRLDRAIDFLLLKMHPPPEGMRSEEVEAYEAIRLEQIPIVRRILMDHLEGDVAYNQAEIRRSISEVNRLLERQQQPDLFTEKLSDDLMSAAIEAGAMDEADMKAIYRTDKAGKQRVETACGGAYRRCYTDACKWYCDRNGVNQMDLALKAVSKWEPERIDHASAWTGEPPQPDLPEYTLRIEYLPGTINLRGKPASIHATVYLPSQLSTFTDMYTLHGDEQTTAHDYILLVSIKKVARTGQIRLYLACHFYNEVLHNMLQSREYPSQPMLDEYFDLRLEMRENFDFSKLEGALLTLEPGSNRAAVVRSEQTRMKELWDELLTDDQIERYSRLMRQLMDSPNPAPVNILDRYALLL